MDGMTIFGIIFLVFSFVWMFAAGLDMLDKKTRKAMWDEVTKKLFKDFEKNKKE